MRDPDQSLILIGAARSGTKLVRDLIATHPLIAKVPYDVNYIWRLGNEGTPHDQLSPEQLSPEIRKKIISKLNSFRGEKPWLVEKTVSNSVRIPFVRSILPEARFLHLLRDGRDVVESVYRQWTAPPDWRYIWKKAQSFPLWDAFGYGVNYGQNLLKKLVVKEKEKVSTWGVRYPGIDQDVATEDLWVVCAKQWVYCLERAMADLATVPPTRVLTLRYEDFVTNPSYWLGEIAQFLEIDQTPYQRDWSEVNTTEIGKGVRKLTPEQWQLISPYLQKPLSLLNYM